MSPKSNNTEQAPKPKLGVFGWLRSRFFTGLVIATPIVAPLLVIAWAISMIDERLKPILRSAIPQQMRNNEVFGVSIDMMIGYMPGIGVLFAVICLILLGAIAANYFGGVVIRTGERIAERLPILGSLYTPLRQLLEIFSDKESSSFKEVVLVEYPKQGTWAVGFLTSRARYELEDKLSNEHVGVFVPTTPNPTSGFLMFVPENEIRRLDMSVEDGAKLIVSAGVVLPKTNGDENGV